MSERHTKGPWRRVDTPDYAEIHAEATKGKQAIALVGDPNDANLIAAAPDLLEALREAQSALALMVSPDAIRQSTVSHAYAQLVAAEAKARAALARATKQEQGR